MTQPATRSAAARRSDDLSRVLDAADAGLEASLDRLFQLMRIESVSTDPAFAPKVRDAADWLAAELGALGFTAEVRPTRGHPMVLARWTGKGAEPRPRVLFYGHYDVQPADPVELWEAPAFEPRLVKGPDGQQIVGRGASDDKGQLMTFIEACRAWISTTGDLPVDVTILLEGEEETGSPSLEPFLDEAQNDLQADVALVCDTAMWDLDTPAVTTSLRGMVVDEVTVTGPSRDLHSGFFGGAARNPIHVLSRIIGDLHGADGRIQIPGFYDGVEDLPSELKAQWDGLGRTDADMLSDIGLNVCAGEAGRSALEMTWARPACDVNGIWGGYTAEGSKTVIPAEASAKVSFRLVGQQDPQAIRQAFRAFVEARLPADCEARFKAYGANPALSLATDSEPLRRSLGALQDEYGKPAVTIGCGGSIPIVGSFKTMLGLDSLMVGFALENDRIHSPNEKYELKSFHKGIRSWTRILEALAG
ncbi:MAG: M20/M25/M40 family metallo-hydrolase [Alphaproteobacteria bacterium]